MQVWLQNWVGGSPANGPGLSQGPFRALPTWAADTALSSDHQNPAWLSRAGSKALAPPRSVSSPLPRLPPR